MMLTLVRSAYLPESTIGRLQVPDLGTFYTVERPWVSNQPWISCIPEGEFIIEPGVFHRNDEDPSNDYPCLVVKEVPGRSLIKFHRANWARELNGCIAPGLALASRPSEHGATEIGVSDSKPALEEIVRWFAPHEYMALKIAFDPAHKAVWEV